MEGGLSQIQSHMVNHKRWKEHTRLLPPLPVGDYVRIQNQVGQWDKTGIVNEVRHYKSTVDSSDRITIVNCKFLQKYTPIAIRSILDDLK